MRWSLAVLRHLQVQVFISVTLRFFITRKITDCFELCLCKYFYLKGKDEITRSNSTGYAIHTASAGGLVESQHSLESPGLRETWGFSWTLQM